MNIAIPINEYNNNNNYLFLEPIENTIIKDSIFHRIILSNDKISTNNIIIHILFRSILIEKYYNKFKCYINSDNEYYDKIINIEKKILENINISKKQVKYNIKDQLSNGSIRIFSNKELENKEYENFQIALKISGIWETDDEYGITFKFYTL